MDVQNVMEKMQERNRELFKVPPYVLYLTRAFSTLEGIGLSANEEYSIISEAFPYLSQRLITDTSPRAKAALRSMVYGSEDKDPSTATPNLTKILSLGDGFTEYSTSTQMMQGESSSSHSAAAGAGGKPASSGESKTASSPSSDDAADELVDVLLSADGNYVQELLLEEAAKLLDATIRDRVAQVSTSGPISALSEALRRPKQIADSTIGRLPLPDFVKDAAILPWKTLDDLTQLGPALARSGKTDEETLEAFGQVWNKLNPEKEDDAAASEPEQSVLGVQLPKVPPALARVQQTDPGPLLEQLGDPDSRLRQRVPLLATLSRRFGATLLRRVATRLEEDTSSPDTPSLARDLAARATDIDRSLADFIEPKIKEPSDSKEESKEVSMV